MISAVFYVRLIDSPISRLPINSFAILCGLCVLFLIQKTRRSQKFLQNLVPGRNELLLPPFHLSGIIIATFQEKLIFL